MLGILVRRIGHELVFIVIDIPDKDTILSLNPAILGFRNLRVKTDSGTVLNDIVFVSVIRVRDGIGMHGR